MGKQKEKRIVEEELTAYEKLRQKVSKTFGELHDKIIAESIS